MNLRKLCTAVMSKSTYHANMVCKPCRNGHSYYTQVHKPIRFLYSRARVVPPTKCWPVCTILSGPQALVLLATPK